MEKCKGIMGRIFGHNFNPVITRSAAKIPGNITRASEEIVEKLREQTFHGCICKRCGATIGANHDQQR